MPTLAALLLATLCLLTPTRAEANLLCRLLGVCFYLSPGFELTVVDAETGKPLPGVYAWAEWVQYVGHGLNGPLMVQEAVSQSDGRLAFPWWGPRLGSGGGIDLGTDPALLLFKPAYAILIVQNGVTPGTDHRAAYRSISVSGQILKLSTFAGSVPERVQQLESLAFASYVGRMTEQQGVQFRTPYLKRLDLVDAELATLPQNNTEVVRLKSALQQDRRFWTGEYR